MAEEMVTGAQNRPFPTPDPTTNATDVGSNSDDNEQQGIFASPSQETSVRNPNVPDKSESINDNQSEKEPLLDKSSEKNPTTKKNRWTLLCLIFASLITPITGICIGLTLGLLYEFNHFASYDSGQTHTLALPGDYVLLSNAIHGGTMYQYSLSFSMPSDNRSHPVDLYHIDCDKMQDVTQNENFGLNFTLTPLLDKVYFDNCSEYLGKCILGEYIYQAKSQISDIDYKITLDSFTPGLTKVQIAAYDNPENFIRFLRDDDHSKQPLKRTEVDQKVYEFILEDDQMEKSAYYFFTIYCVIDDYKPSSFTMNLMGLHVYYNASSLTPFCTMNSTNSFTCSINNVRDKEDCFLGHVRQDNNVLTAKSRDLFYIAHSVHSPKPTGTGRSIVWSCFAVFILLMLCCVLYGRC